MTVDPANAARAQLAVEKDAKLAVKREKYINERLRQIKIWYAVGWLFWIILAIATFWIYQQKPVYLDPRMLAVQIGVGKLPSNELAQLAALGSLLFWGMIALIAGFILQIYIAMYSEHKLIRLFEHLHQADLAKHQTEDHTADSQDSTAQTSSGDDQTS